MRELDMVVLTRDIPEHALKKGDVGTVAHCYAGGDAYEVEFVTADGRTVAVLTLSHRDIRPAGGREILHIRPLAQV